MTTVYKYRAHCTVHSTNEIIWGTSEPQSDAVHTFDSVVAIDKVVSDQVKIKEETIPTGGNFAVTTIKINAIKNTTSSAITFFPFPISAMSIEYTTNSTHVGDKVSMCVGKDTITGGITANVAPAAAWSAQNYTAGQVVTYTHPIFGVRVYTCTTDTVSNDAPTNTTYWRHGLEISVQQTVIDNTCIGYYLKLDDLTNADDLGRVVYVDKSNLKVYVENNCTNTFSAFTPTYVRQTVYSLKDCEIGVPWVHDIGQSKIGGSYIPADTIVTIEYENLSTDTDKEIVGLVEYLY